MNSFIDERRFIYKGLIASIVASSLILVLIAGSFSSVQAQNDSKVFWGAHGSGPGQFDDPAGIVVDPKGYVFIVDSDNNRIQKLNSGNGTFVSEWGTFGKGPGQFNRPLGITMDYAKGYVYVTDTGNDRVQKFSRNGTFITKWGTPGNGPGQFSIPIGIDEDESKQNLYTSDLGNDRIMRFGSNGLFVSEWGSLGSAPGQFNNPGRVEQILLATCLSLIWATIVSRSLILTVNLSRCGVLTAQILENSILLQA